MPTRTEYNATLDKLAKLLRKEPLTARAIARELKCCRPSAYQRLRALRKRGDPVYELPAAEEQGKPGPRSVAYGIRS